MKNLEKIFMLVALMYAISSMVISIYSGTSWTWQLATIMWVLVAYMQNKLITRYKNLISKLTK